MALRNQLPILTADHLASFERDGFLHLPAQDHGLVPDLDSLRQWVDEIYQWPLVKGKWMPYDEVNPEGKRLVMRTEKIVDYHPGVHSILCGDGVQTILQQLTGKVGSLPIFFSLSHNSDNPSPLTCVVNKGDVTV